MSGHQWDPQRAQLNLGDARLNRLFRMLPETCATLPEYAQAVGMDVSEVAAALAGYLADNVVAFEYVNGEMFLHTAPSGRPLPPGHPDVAPNLWEMLRVNTDTSMAFALWQLLRSLERAGWKTEVKESAIRHTLGKGLVPPPIGIYVGHTLVGVEPFPTPTDLWRHEGVLDRYHAGGAGTVAVTCDEGQLDSLVTGVRRWVLEKKFTPKLTCLILEAPRYHPVLLSPGDGAINPVWVSRESPPVNPIE